MQIGAKLVENLVKQLKQETTRRVATAGVKEYPTSNEPLTVTDLKRDRSLTGQVMHRALDRIGLQLVAWRLARHAACPTTGDVLLLKKVAGHLRDLQGYTFEGAEDSLAVGNAIHPLENYDVRMVEAVKNRCINNHHRKNHM